MTVEEQLKTIIKNQYDSVRAFTNYIGIPYTTLDSVFRRGIAKSGIGTMLKIFEALGLDVESIPTGKLQRKSSVTITTENQDEQFQLIAQNYHKLNDRGKTALMEQSEVMASMPQYIDDDIKSNSLSADTVEREEVG